MRTYRDRMKDVVSARLAVGLLGVGVLGMCVVGGAGPASATSAISCSAIDGGAGIDILFGAGPVPSVFAVTVSQQSRVLSTQGLPGTEPVSIARAFVDTETVKIDLLDDQAERLAASIRLLRSAGDEPLQIGYLKVENQPPVGVTCIGP